MDTETDDKNQPLTPEQEAQAKEIGKSLRPEILKHLLSVAEKLEGVKLNSDNYTIKIDKEGRRMKLHIKLTKEESDNYESFRKAVADAMPEDEFAKMIFLMGVQSMHSQIQERISNLTEEEKKLIEEDNNADPSNE